MSISKNQEGLLILIDIATVDRYNVGEGRRMNMMVKELLHEKKLSMYRLAKESGIPYTTVVDICNGKAKLGKCSAETIYKLAHVLNISMEALLEPCMEKRISFELFKSNVCHQLKSLGDIDFIIQTLESDDIRKYYRREWYPESLYLLAMLDYVSRINNVPLCTQYDDLRRSKLSDTVYPSSIVAVASATKNDQFKKQALRDAIPEFVRFNIVENEVRNVV